MYNLALSSGEGSLEGGGERETRGEQVSKVNLRVVNVMRDRNRKAGAELGSLAILWGETPVQRGFDPRTSEEQDERSHRNCDPGRNARTQKSLSSFRSRKTAAGVADRMTLGKRTGARLCRTAQALT